jgi:succinate dehydrogenase / fumarate reductase cytochrome b subunit
MYKTTGFLSFFIRRVTGVALVIYLFIHIWVIGSALGGPASFDARLALVQGPVFTIFEILLLGAVIYHTIDGIRLLVVHYFRVTEYRKSLFYAMLVTGAILLIGGGVPLFLFALEQM